MERTEQFLQERIRELVDALPPGVSVTFTRESLVELLKTAPPTSAPVPVVQPKSEERWLTPAEAAKFLGVSRDWIYDNVRHLPFARKFSHKVLRIEEAGLRRWAEKRGR